MAVTPELLSFFRTKRDAELLAQFDPERVPLHVAIIMDGNGRWATKRGLPRVAGHRAGAKAVEEAISSAIKLGVRHLTIYSFSTENWRRPADEVDSLMGLFVEVLKAKMRLLQRERVRVRVIGALDQMPPDTAQAYRDAMKETEANEVLQLIVALNYGSRDELVAAARSLARDAASGSLDPDLIDEDAVAARLDTAGIPDPELLIRTSGEMRLSNFLLWQIAYSELYVTGVLWPDFDRHDFLRAVLDFQHRERRFGGR